MSCNETHYRLVHEVNREDRELVFLLSSSSFLNLILFNTRSDILVVGRSVFISDVGFDRNRSLNRDVIDAASVAVRVV